MKQLSFLLARQSSGFRVLWLSFILIAMMGMKGWGQTTYYLKTASQTNANIVTNWYTDTTGGGGGTNATVFTGTGDTWVILGAQNAIFANSTSTTFAGTLQVNGTLTVAATIANNSATVTVTGTVLLNATDISQVTVTSASGTGNNTFALGSSGTLKTKNTFGIYGTSCSIAPIDTKVATVTLPISANYEFNGATNQATLGLPATVNNLTINNTGTTNKTVTLGQATTVSNDLTITSGILDVSTSNFALNVNGNWINNASNTAFNGQGSSVTFNGITQAINGSASTTFNSLAIGPSSTTTMDVNNTCSTLSFNSYNNGTGAVLTHSGSSALTVNGVVNINQPGAIAINAWNINTGSAKVSGLITFGGSISTVTRIGKINITTGTLNANGGIKFTEGASACHVIDMSTGDGTGTLNLKGILTVPANSSTLTAGTSGSNFNYIDANAQTINFFSAGAYNNLLINNTSGASLSGAITTTNVTGNISVGSMNTGSLLSTGNFAITLAASKSLTVESNSTVNAGTSVISFGTNGVSTINGTFKTSNISGFSGAAGTAISFTNSPSITLGTGSTVEYTALIGSQAVTGRTYNNLTLDNTSGTNTAGALITVNGTLKTTVGGTLNMGTNTLSVNTVDHSGILSSQNIGSTPISSGKTWGGTITYDASGDQTIALGTYNNLTLSGSGIKTISTATDGILANGILYIYSTGNTKVSITNNNIKVNKLQFGEVIKAAGTWGYGPDNPPAITNQTYFANTTGYLNVTTGSLDHFAISTIPSPQIAGTPITGIILTAQDANNNTVTSFTGPVTYSGTAGITGTSSNFIAGVLTSASIIPKVAGNNMTFIVTGSTKTGMATIATINSGALHHFAISTISSPQIAGTPITGITLTAQDANNNTVTEFKTTVTYGGTTGITGTSSNFIAGVLTSASIIPKVAGNNMTFIVTGSTKTGMATIATINPGALYHFAISTISSPQNARSPFNVTITAQDAMNNTVTGFVGKVNMTTTAGTITPSTSNAFTGGILTQNFAVTQAGMLKTITVINSAGLQTGTSNEFTVIIKTSIADGSWNEPTTWAPAGVPTASEDVIVDHVVTIDNTATCKNLTINTAIIGKSLTINAGKDLTVTGDLTTNDLLAINSEAALTDIPAGAGSGSLIVKGTSTGNITYNRWLDHTGDTFSRWYITSAPVNVTSGFDVAKYDGIITNTSKIHLTPNTGTPPVNEYDFATYSESNNDWTYVSVAASIPSGLSAGKGYLISLNPATDGMIQFTGIMNNGDVTPLVASSTNNGWNAVGNPYTSAIKVVGTGGFIEANTANLNPSYAAIYVWNEDATYNGTQQYYRVIGNSGYIPAGGAFSVLSESNIQTGQGFMIHSNGTSPSVTFNKAMQVHQPTLTLKSAEVSWPGITLLAESHGQTRSTVVAFNEKMTPGLDVTYDAGLLASDYFQVYTHLVGSNNDVDFTIQCLPDNQYSQLSVPVGVDLPEGGELVFKASGIILPDGLYPVIEDKVLNMKTALKSEIDNYTITLAKNTTGIGRFYLSFGGSALWNPEVDLQTKYTASFVNNRIVINGAVEPGTKALLYDISGRKVGEYSLEYINHNEIYVSGLSQRVYLLKIIAGNYSQTIKLVSVYTNY